MTAMQRKQKRHSPSSRPNSLDEGRIEARDSIKLSNPTHRLAALDRSELAEWAGNARHTAFFDLIDLWMRRRDQEGWTQAMLAERLGVNKGLISRRLNGNMRLSSDTLSDMARALNGRLSMRVDAMEDISRRNDGIAAPDEYSTFGILARAPATPGNVSGTLTVNGAITLTVKPEALAAPHFYSPVPAK